jgi:hypothetical protein
VIDRVWRVCECDLCAHIHVGWCCCLPSPKLVALVGHNEFVSFSARRTTRGARGAPARAPQPATH